MGRKKGSAPWPLATKEDLRRRGEQLVELEIERLRRSKEKVIDLWGIYTICRRTGVPLPKELGEYLDGVAEALLRLSHDPPPAGKAGAEVLKALGFTGKRSRNGNPFHSPERRNSHEFEITWQVYVTHCHHRDNQRKGVGAEMPLDDIFLEVAASHRCEFCRSKPVGHKTVERIFRANLLRVVPPYVLSRAKSHKVADILR